MTHTPRPVLLHAYVAAVAAGAAALLVILPPSRIAERPWHALLVGVLTAVVSLRPVRIRPRVARARSGRTGGTDDSR